MSEGTIAAYNLGKTGVVVDKSLVHAEDGELSKAQNAIHDKHGSDGGICNREGLLKYHSVAAAGTILGFIGAPLGPGPALGAEDQKVYYVPNTAGTWYKSTSSFSTSTVTTVLAAAKQYTTTVMRNGRLYYISAAETIRVFDGVQDALFFTPPPFAPTVLALFMADGTLYAGLANGTTSSYVVEIDSDGRMTQLGTALSASYLVSSLLFHQNDIFVGAVKSASQGRVYRIRRDTALSTTAWTQDYETVGFTNVDSSSLASFRGLLYYGVAPGAGDTAVVYVRSATGVYTASDTATGTASDVTSLAVYEDILYAAFSHYSGAGTANVIRRTTNGTVWSTAATLGTEDGLEEFYRAGNKLFIVNSDQQAVAGYYSTTGTTWTPFAVSPSDTQEGFAVFPASGDGASFGATSSFIVLQGGTTLQILNAAGTLITLVMPTGVTLDASRPPRFAIFDRFVIMVNTPSRPVTIDSEGVVRVLTPLPPTRQIELDDDGGAGLLTGNYRALQTYIIRDDQGNIISESDFSPFMESAFAASADTLDAEQLNISADNISGSQIYRTSAGGDTYFPWIVVDGNVLTQSVSDDQPDAALSLVAAPILGSTPNLALVASWRGRVWGVDRADVDHLRYTETGQQWAWPRDNDILVGREGSDIRGITAIIARRDALGAGKRESLNQITGTSEENFRSVVLTENCGVESQETVCVYRDTAYFLWKDGVYTWDSSGIKCISDKKVRSWFVTNSDFNRDRFQYSYACIDPVRNKYKLFLSSADASVENRWVEYDIDDGNWWGPHKTDAFTPKSAGTSTSATDRSLYLFGSSSGFLWRDQTLRTDDTATAIEMEIDTKRHDGGTPKIDKIWKDLVVSLVPQTGGVITINPFVGELNSLTASYKLQAELADGSYNVGRLGLGKSAKLQFRHQVAGRLVQILGYEIDFVEAGQR